MKKHIPLILALALAVLLVVYGHLGTANGGGTIQAEDTNQNSADTVLAGDVNQNGSVDSGDATLVLRHVVGSSNLTDKQMQVADVNQNGRVDSGDASMILRLVVDPEETPDTTQTPVVSEKPDTSEEPTETDETPTVYMTTEITPEALMEIYRALDWAPEGRVAVKVSTGEPPASNYLDPQLIKDLVQHVHGTIVECNTAYGGSRSQTAMHYQVAKDHGFTDIADFQILDEDGSMTLKVNGGSVLTENYVGKAFSDYNSYLILSHFKGHSMAGFGGAIKNISIGIGSSEGKAWIHSGGTSRTNPWGGKQDAFLEAMAEAGKSVSDYLGNGERIIYINVMNRLSIDCDCSGHPAEPDIHDIGILASTDPVALDQACVDLIYQAEGNTAFVRRMEGLNAQHVLEHGEEIGLGSRTYTLVSIDN